MARRWVRALTEHAGPPGHAVRMSIIPLASLAQAPRRAKGGSKLEDEHWIAVTFSTSH
jgi:hypothetical protein